MTGYQREIDGKKITIGVSTIPNRKKPCLAVSSGNCITKYATFNNEEAAYEFMDIFADFIGAERIDWFGRYGGGIKNDCGRSDRNIERG